MEDESQLIAALRAGDEQAFMGLVERYHRPLLRLARTFVPSQAVAEEVVQETWLAVLQGIGAFEERSSLKTWIFRILTNRARRRGEREARVIPFADLARQATEGDEPAVDPTEFLPPGSVDAGWWASYPQRWEGAPDQRLLAAETRSLIDSAIAELNEAQRSVITLRDIEGWSSKEVCNLLMISEVNQRVLLHRARAKVCSALAQYVAEG